MRGTAAAALAHCAGEWVARASRSCAVLSIGTCACSSSERLAAAPALDALRVASSSTHVTKPASAACSAVRATAVSKARPHT
eukprot:894537-Prymnesium_polylepis.1